MDEEIYFFSRIAIFLLKGIELKQPTLRAKDSKHGFWGEIVSGDLVLTEHAPAKGHTKVELESVEWLPANITLIDKYKAVI